MPNRSCRPCIAIAALALATALAGCARHPAAATPAARPAPSAPTVAAAGKPAAPPTVQPLALPDRCRTRVCTPAERLAAELEAAFAAPATQTAVWSVLAQSFDTGEVLFRLNPDTLVVPASNEKIVTTAVASARLGWDFRYETRLETSAPVEGGVLRGDLVVVGGGDPTINGRGGDRDAVFASFASALREAGISRIDGRIVGDDDAFEERRYGQGWAWDDFAYGYQAPVGALQFNEDLVDVAVRPGGAVGEAAGVELRPGEHGLRVVNRVTTAAGATEPDVDIWRFPGSDVLEVIGTVPLDGKETVRGAAVDNPTLFFVRAFRASLIAHGIEVRGEAVDGDEITTLAAGSSQRAGRHSGVGDRQEAVDGDEIAPHNPAAGVSRLRPDGTAGSGVQGPRKATASSHATVTEPPRRVLARHESPPLSELAKTLMKASQNLYAETVFRTLSLRPGPATVAASRRIVEETLGGWGVAPGQFNVADGSGLSRRNYVSASMIVRILRAMTRDPEGFAAFEATLPIAGKDGTLAGRMKATRAEGNVKAKTGTLGSVRALSGYVRSADGELIGFAMIANNFLVPTAVVDALVDGAVERLAAFTRK